MKKAILISLFALTTSASWGCRLLVKNDTQKAVVALDFGQTIDQIIGRYMIKPGETRQVNANPTVHARVSIRVDNIVFKIKQIACSKTHKIMVKVSDLLKGKFDEKLLRVTKRVALSTLVFAPPKAIDFQQIPQEES